MKTISIILTVLAVLVGVGVAQAQPDSLWSRTYGGSNSDPFGSFVQTADGGFALAGQTSFGMENGEFYLVRTNADGDSLWSRTFGGEQNDQCSSIIQTADGGLALAGSTSSFGASRYFWLVRTNADGDSLWSRTFGGPRGEGLYSLIQTTDGGFAMAGKTSSFGAGITDFWLVRTDSNGDSLWSRTFGGSRIEECHSLIQTADGGFALAGTTVSYGAGGDDFWLVRTNADGDSLWSRTFGGRLDDDGLSLIQTTDGGFALAGYTQSFGAGSGDMWLVRTDSDGDSLWSRTFGGREHEYCSSIIQTADGGFALVGGTQSFDADGGDFWLVRTDSGGDSLWSRTFGGWNGDSGYSLIQTADGGFALAGNTRSFGAGDADFWLVKTGPDPVSVSEPIEHPLSYAFDAPFPNPFNSQIQITYSLLKASLISIRLFDIAGREVATLIAGELQTGNHTAVWNAEGFTSGIYLVKMETSAFSEVRKVTLIR